MPLAEQTYEEAKHLPDGVAQEVLDFTYKTDLIRAQQGAMDKIWDNREDDVWNDD